MSVPLRVLPGPFAAPFPSPASMPMTVTTVLAVCALLLDMDGTLVDPDAVVERIWRRWADRHGLDGDEVLKVAHGRQAHASMAVLLPDRPVGRIKRRVVRRASVFVGCGFLIPVAFLLWCRMSPGRHR